MASKYLASKGIDLSAIMTAMQQGGEAVSSGLQSATMTASEHIWRLSATPVSRIVRARIPHKPPFSLWDIALTDGRIASVEAHDPTAPSVLHLSSVYDARGRLLAPSLCHAHVHLDKCFLLQDPKYADLEIIEGDFQEAMELTGKAKALFEPEDLLRRGARLIEESMECGVTAMRAFVEVDEVVGLKCLDAGLKLRADFEESCEVQLCAFAQLPLFTGEDGGAARRDMMEEAISRQRVDVLGSTPYVEADEEKMKQNVTWMIEKAMASGKHLDFHLDYHLDVEVDALVWFVVSELKRLGWPKKSTNGKKTVCLGHCTRLTLFDKNELDRLREEIGDLPIHFIGLPTSDLYMMARPDSDEETSGHRARGTLMVPDLIQKHNLSAALSINNVGNAFTPQGCCDPLSLASWGVALYHSARKQDAELLYECVSSRAKAAIGLTSPSLELLEGESADFLLYGSKEHHWRRRKTISDLVYDPTRPSSRFTFLHGKERRVR